MARARNIKPSYFKHEDLAECGIEAHFLFAGLWCLADREGRLKDKPRTIQNEVLPFYDVDVDALLHLLASHPKNEKEKFIIRYEVDGVKYIQITKFYEHQNPHVKEAESTIPPYVGLLPEKHQKSTGLLPEKHQKSRADSLIPDSLIPDSDDKVPYQKIADTWNEKCGDNYPRVTNMGKTRREHLRARWEQFGGSLETFEKLFGMVNDSVFLQGQNNRNWKANFDWVIKNEDNPIKVLEGNYVNKGPPEEPLCNGDDIIW